MSLVKSAQRLGINISCLSEYYHNKNGAEEHTIVINYSGIEKEKIEAAVSLLGKAIKVNT